jgi:hypothetical protein
MNGPVVRRDSHRICRSRPLDVDVSCVWEVSTRSVMVMGHDWGRLDSTQLDVATQPDSLGLRHASSWSTDASHRIVMSRGVTPTPSILARTSSRR